MVPGTRLELVHLAAADFESAASTDSATPARVRGAIIRHSIGSHKRMSLTLDDFDYPLPAELIAQAPLPERSASRLLVVDDGKLHDQAFGDLPAWLHPGDLLVFNDTRVIHARLHGIKDTGGQVEVKELVWLEIQLTAQQTVNFWAEVVDQASEIGFALKFNSSSPEDEEALAKYLESIFQSQAAN